MSMALRLQGLRRGSAVLRNFEFSSSSIRCFAQDAEVGQDSDFWDTNFSVMVVSYGLFSVHSTILQGRKSHLSRCVALIKSIFVFEVGEKLSMWTKTIPTFIGIRRGMNALKNMAVFEPFLQRELIELMNNKMVEGGWGVGER